MKARATITAVAIILAIGTSGCTMGYRNGQVCKQRMIDTYPSALPTLSYRLPQTAYQGKRVVVEATYTLVLKTEVAAGPVGSPPASIQEKKYKGAPAAVECTFNGVVLTGFRWLSPEKLAKEHETEDGDSTSH